MAASYVSARLPSSGPGHPTPDDIRFESIKAGPVKKSANGTADMRGTCNWRMVEATRTMRMACVAATKTKRWKASGSNDNDDDNIGDNNEDEADDYELPSSGPGHHPNEVTKLYL